MSSSLLPPSSPFHHSSTAAAMNLTTTATSALSTLPSFPILPLSSTLETATGASSLNFVFDLDFSSDTLETAAATAASNQAYNLPSLPSSLAAIALSDKALRNPPLSALSPSKPLNSVPVQPTPAFIAVSTPARSGQATPASVGGLAGPTATVTSLLTRVLQGRDGGEGGGGGEEGSEREREKRWEGWSTSTSTVYVTDTAEVPTAITIYTTYGETGNVIDGGTTVETVYEGASTLTVQGPSYLTLTFYPTTTTYSTSKTTVPTTTKTKTSTAGGGGGAGASASTQKSEYSYCAEGDADEKEFGGLKPTHDQSITLCTRYRHLIFGIAIGWNLFILRDLLYPFKVFTVAVHELGHVLTALCLGLRIGRLVIDPKLGGLTTTVVYLAENVEDRTAPLPFAALPAGYLMNIVVGGLLTFAGFDTLASKIASFIVGMCWIGVFLRVQFLAKLMTLGAIGLMIGLWFVDHGWGLRFYILFMGVMSSFYVLWDVADDAFFAKQHQCCPALMAIEMPLLSPGLWTLIWFIVSFILFIGFILAALATWKQSPHAMYCQAQTFLPTR